MPDPTNTPSESTSQEQDPSPKESEKTPSTPESSDGVVSEEVVVEDLEVVAAPGVEDFQNPLLKGKTPEEIDKLFEVQTAANRSMNTEMNRMHGELQTQTEAPVPAPVEEEVDYGDDFISDRFRMQEGRIIKALKDMVEPLIKNNMRSASGDARTNLRKDLKHFSTLEPHIDSLLRSQNIDPNEVTETQLTTLYHTAVGMAAHEGINLESAAPAPTTPEPIIPAEAPPMNIPQHRPSSAPLPIETPKEPQRPLTEEERILAQQFFGSHKDPEAEYRKYQDMDEDSVVKPGFSSEGWK